MNTPLTDTSTDSGAAPTAARTVLITGGTSGIGAATARLLLARGHRVAVTGRDPGRLKAFLDEAGPADRVLGLTADASDWDSTEAAVAGTVERFGSLDAAIANAGGASPDHFRPGGAGVVDGGDPELWAPMVLANVLGPALLAKATLPHLEQSGGRLVLIGSVAGIKNSPGNLYSATKWAVVGFAENLRLHATARGVGVTVVNPGMIDTAFWHGQTPPIAMSPDAVAEAIAFALDQPAGVDLNTVTIRPIGQPV
ncbi:SDR family NAD(P)-dependent oxidoreductase [Streptomyces sp. DSM 44917]|uniref:SDR family NAD(P)-dependent oxidoreductase n=1 Tax=Streptomyces boetiae TaxID=3075541 RepID=A0ABU2L452_9ACTN|nr:SDR family NAD(P)-dependent oxidoreductase [Streptomyces sp. DSM 44917]MDT0306339.1 SDR family NAD(P)-dependent oxidoreductase [Streptomyces sp. DSM 44917]